jgi:hypothetical protein
MKYEGTFLQVNVHFNMHFLSKVSSTVTTLLPLTSAHDIAKVFFTAVQANSRSSFP